MINDIHDWKEISRGYYRYVIAAKVAYEILITSWLDPENTNILTNAYGCLYITGIWKEEGKQDWVFDRENIDNGFVYELLEFAKKDYEDMKNVSLL